LQNQAKGGSAVWDPIQKEGVKGILSADADPRVFKKKEEPTE